MASIDIAKAFDRVVHPAILRGLRRKGVQEEFISYIADFYETSSTVLTFQGKSLLVHPTAGVRQGDPLSPLLFNLVLDEFLEHLDSELAFTSENLRVSGMAFADDLILAASTPEGLRIHLQKLQEFLEERGLRANPTAISTRTSMGRPPRQTGFAVLVRPSPANLSKNAALARLRARRRPPSAAGRHAENGEDADSGSQFFGG
ncbi:hypothetical protein MTO96_031490 [Rhipicephalus appendiculatus]